MNDSQQPHRGAVVLTLGIVSFFCCITGLFAWPMANKDLQAMEAGQMDPDGRGLTQAGKILAIVAISLNVVWILFYAVILAIGLAAS